MADINVTFDTPSIDVELTGGFTIDTTARTASTEALEAATTAETNAADALTAATTAETNAASALTAVTTAVDNFADEYDSTATYSVGEYCLYDSVLYVCTTAVETAGDFDSSYWTQVTVGDELTEIENNVFSTTTVSAEWAQGGINSGTNVTSTKRIRTVDYISLDEAVKITLVPESGYYFAITFYDSDYTFISTSSAWETSAVVYTKSDWGSDAAYYRIVIRESSNAVITTDESSNISWTVTTSNDTSAVLELVNVGDILADATWEQGGINDGAETTATARIRTDYIEIGYSSQFTVAVVSGYYYAINFYDVNKTYITSSSEWQTSGATYSNSDFDGAAYIRFVLRYSAGGVITTDAGANLACNIVCPSSYVQAYIDEKISAAATDETTDRYNDLLSQARFSPTSGANVLTLMHFSDIHNNLSAMEKAIELSETYSDKIDDMIHTGDVVTANYSDGLDNWIDSGCAEKVISVIGNHDSEENLVLGTAGQTTVYAGMLEPYISNWDVVQPTGVDDSSSNYYCACYYYKDYTDVSMRLIVLDTNWWDDYEQAWLSDVLDDALTNSYAVILACHTPLYITGIENCNFTSYTEQDISESTAYANISDGWLDPVDTFISDGGEVICMLSGHNHRDHIGYLTNYPNVLCITADKASIARTIDSARISGELNETAFNMVTFNTTDKLIKIVRIGAEVDGQMRGKHVFCYDYANQQIISQW